MVKVLGIETSCDETAAAVVEGGKHILSSIVASQVELHARYGGIVPEVASRQHILTILPVVERALGEAGGGLDGGEGIAVTRGAGRARPPSGGEEPGQGPGPGQKAPPGGGEPPGGPSLLPLACREPATPPRPGPPGLRGSYGAGPDEGPWRHPTTGQDPGRCRRRGPGQGGQTPGPGVPGRPGNRKGGPARGGPFPPPPGPD